jgi:hypothetical protein
MTFSCLGSKANSLGIKVFGIQLNSVPRRSDYFKNGINCIRFLLEKGRLDFDKPEMDSTGNESTHASDVIAMSTSGKFFAYF